MTSKSKSNERDEYYGPLISMLRETIAQLQKASEAGHQGEEASIQTLRRRCFEAEERVRRADREVAELRYEADELHKRLASKMQGHRGDVTLLKEPAPDCGEDHITAVNLTRIVPQPSLRMARPVEAAKEALAQRFPQVGP